MKKIKGLLYLFTVVIVAMGSIFAPDLLFKIIDAETLGQVSQIRLDDNTVFLTKVATKNDKISLFGDSYEEINITLDDKEKEEVLNNAENEIDFFFSPLGYSNIGSEAGNVSVEKNIYLRKEGSIYSFAAYVIRYEKDNGVMEFIVDATEFMILQVDLQINNQLMSEKAKVDGSLYQDIYNQILYADTDETSLHIEVAGIKILSNYYGGYEYEIKSIESIVTNANSGIYKPESVYDYYYIPKDLAYVYQLVNFEGESLEYNIEVTESNIIFNN